MTHDELIWDHFKFNAEQRLKAFNFFLLFSIFTNGGVINAIDKHLSPWLLLLLGVFLCILSAVFWIADSRSSQLLSLSVEAMLNIEKNYPAVCQIFRLDAEHRKKFVRYTVAFATLLIVQFAFGLGVVAYSLHLFCVAAR
ncbi:RipA family octameric membrane protein [Rhodanobacter umsongensis]